MSLAACTARAGVQGQQAAPRGVAPRDMGPHMACHVGMAACMATVCCCLELWHELWSFLRAGGIRFTEVPPDSTLDNSVSTDRHRAENSDGGRGRLGGRRQRSVARPGTRPRVRTADPVVTRGSRSAEAGRDSGPVRGRRSNSKRSARATRPHSGQRSPQKLCAHCRLVSRLVR